MAEMILPGTYIEVRPEGLITPGRVTVGALGVVGTASKGPIGEPVILGSYAEARQHFGDYDVWINGTSGELTLVRALEIAYNHGATRVIAMRVTGTEAPVADSRNFVPAWNRDTTARYASRSLASASGTSAILRAKTPGNWASGLSVNVAAAEDDAIVEDEEHNGSAAITLAHKPVVRSSRNRVRLIRASSGVTRFLSIRYDGDSGALASGQVEINRATGGLSFLDAEKPAADDVITVSYVVGRASAVKVTLRLGRAEEVYTVVSGSDLVADIGRSSAWVSAEAGDNPNQLPTPNASPTDFASFSGGDNGASGADYQAGLDGLLQEDVHIIVAAGQDNGFSDELDAHCQQASTDAIKRDRIAVVGSRLNATLDEIMGHTVASDRVVFVAPGIVVTDRAAQPPVDVTLPGAYAAAAIAGLLASYSAHISLTNKTLRVSGLERRYTSAELTSLVQNRVLALESRQGLRVVKAITTSTNTAWHQITTRRIVDYAKYGVRSATGSYIGLLNNERVRGALRATINSFLTDMVNAEMLISYELNVTATRDEERQGIVRVTMVLRPVFSIDFIVVTMFLE
jgi:hypothetical protein